MLISLGNNEKDALLDGLEFIKNLMKLNMLGYSINLSVPLAMASSPGEYYEAINIRNEYILSTTLGELVVDNQKKELDNFASKENWIYDIMKDWELMNLKISLNKIKDEKKINEIVQSINNDLQIYYIEGLHAEYYTFDEKEVKSISFAYKKDNSLYMLVPENEYALSYIDTEEIINILSEN